MRVVAGIGGVILIALMLAEFFVTFMLPRRVKRDPRIARGLNRLLWLPWRAVARRLPPASADTLLGFFGPLGLLLELLTWALGLILGFEVRVELVRDDGQHLLAQLTQEEAQQLELERGRIVYVRPSRETVFAR